MPSYFTLQLLPLMLLSGPEISFPCLCSIDSYSFLQAHLKMASGAAFCFNEVSFIKLIYHTQFIPSALWKHLFPSVSKTTTFAPYMTFLYSKFDGLFPSGSKQCYWLLELLMTYGSKVYERQNQNFCTVTENFQSFIYSLWNGFIMQLKLKIWLEVWKIRTLTLSSIFIHSSRRGARKNITQ